MRRHNTARWSGFALSALNVMGAAGAQAPGTSTGHTAKIPFATVQHIDANDSQATAVAKAAKVLPRPRQSSWMRLERTFFIHFGPNTFRGVEWGNGHEDPSLFNPTQFDADQWMRTIRDGGGKMVILVCKHHDGFVLWPSRYTQHSVAASPWLDGKGDEVRAVAQAARKYGIELGVYLSPADLWQLKTNVSNPKGFYGNGSPERPSTIPTDPARFLDDPKHARATHPGSPSFQYNVDDYNRYFLNQLYELLTDYGPIREVWFDGANPDRSVQERYDYAAWYSMIRKLQPNAIIFGKGPDGRWVGNEKGIGRTTEWDVIPLPKPPDEFVWPDMTDADLGSRAKLMPSSYLWWYAPEINAPILHGWFWSPSKESRTAAELVDMYYTSVGRNGNWLLNLSPDRRGLIPDDQIAQLQGMAGIVKKTFAIDLARGASAHAQASAAEHGAAAVLDGSLDTWWEAPAGATSGELVLTLPRVTTFDVVSLQEAIDHRGQRIERFALDAWENGSWQEVDKGTTVGHKRLLRLTTPVTTTKVRIRIEESRLEPSLAEVGLFKQAQMTQGPEISERDLHGNVTLKPHGPAKTVFTTDGSIPTPRSPIYKAPLQMKNGGTLQAALRLPNGELSLVSEKHFIGMTPLGWKAGTDANMTNAAVAVDGNAGTIWEATTDGSLPALTIDMGAMQSIAGFTYLPRLDGSQMGVVERYRLETSEDGKQWQTQVEDGRFDNMRNNPDYQEVRFATTHARYLRFTPLVTFGGNKVVSAAEISVLPASSK